jgi:hypothetical protein
LSPGESFFISGSLFRGISEGSTGNGQDSPCDYPVLLVTSLEGGQSLFVPSTNWSTNSFASAPVKGLPPGYALATMFVNGIPGLGLLIDFRSAPVPIDINIAAPKTLADGSFGFSFTNTPGALFHVLSATNILAPVMNWTLLGQVSEVSSGEFEFVDPRASNAPGMFYRVRSP